MAVTPTEPDSEFKGGINLYHRNVTLLGAAIGRGCAWGGFWIGLGLVIAAAVLHG